MISESLFSSNYTTTLKRALTAYSLRHRVVSNNISNVGTEGYSAQRVRFEDALAGARSGKLAGRRTAGGHLAIGQGAKVSDAEIVPSESPHENGINNVDVDNEMAALAKNDLAFRLATRLLSRTYQGFRNAITGEHR